MTSSPHIVIYDWAAWKDSLLESLAHSAGVIEAIPSDRADDLLDQVPQNTSFFVFHLNFSWTSEVPVDRQKLLAGLESRGVQVVNASCTDISKQVVQSECRRLELPSVITSHEGDPQERLIVKTNANFAGPTPMRLRREGWSVSGASETDRRICHPKAYRVLRRMDIPPKTWTAPDLVVERYIDNCDHRFYRAYVCLNELVISAVINENLIKKMDTGIPRTDFFGAIDSYKFEDSRICAVADVATRFAQGFHLDYGTIDIVMDDHDTPYVIDANTTPWWGEPSRGYITDFLSGGFRR